MDAVGEISEEIRDQRALVERIYARPAGGQPADHVVVFLAGYLAALDDVLDRLAGQPWRKPGQLHSSVEQLARITS